tara:strand:+ start:12758 stop:14035 length:1278 start_codon:yes stop_codon:yes gene_type:complete
MSATPSSILWRASSSETIDAPPLSRDTDVDLLVIGGGFTGTSAALQAARSGASVCLLEAETFGYGGSGRNVGLVNAGLWLPPDRIVEQLGEAEGGRLIDVLGQGPGDVFALIEREAIQCEATRSGTLHLAHSQAGVNDLKERCRQGTRHGAPLRLLNREDTELRTGTNAFSGALFDPRAGTIHPLAYCQGLARAAQAQGSAICEHSKVTALTRDGDRWRAVANGHRVRARHVIVATNAYHLGLNAPFTPAFTVVNYCQFATAPLPPAVRETILPNGEGCWDTAMVMSSIRLDQAGRLIVGGVGSMEHRGKDFHLSWARRKLRQLYPQLPAASFDYAWSGRIAMTDDHIPKIVKFGPNAYSVFGYSGRGIAPGTVFGKALADTLLLEPHGDLPLAATEHYAERFSRAKAYYYEFGAKLVHGVSARL